MSITQGYEVRSGALAPGHLEAVCATIDDAKAYVEALAAIGVRAAVYSGGYATARCPVMSPNTAARCRLPHWHQCEHRALTDTWPVKVPLVWP